MRNSILDCFDLLERGDDGSELGDYVEIKRGGPIVTGLTIVDEFGIDLEKIKMHDFDFTCGTVEKLFDDYEEGDWLLEFNFKCCNFVLRICLDKDIEEENIIDFVAPVVAVIDNYHDSSESVH